MVIKVFLQNLITQKSMRFHTVLRFRLRIAFFFAFEDVLDFIV